MAHDNNRTLAIRALNAVRPVHVPTYLATRALFESIAGDRSSNWGDLVSPYKYALREKGRYYPAPAFKGISKDGEHIYRDFHIPSPSTLLAESAALSALASSEPFGKIDNVFSYKWPSSSACPYNFEHFMNGFRLRQEKVSALAEANPNATVVSLDIKTFYPTIDRDEALRHFNLKLNNSNLPRSSKRNAARLADHLCSELDGTRGIPTGPEFSHLLADCALNEFDEQFAERYGENYLRYVDDLIFVVPPGETDSVIESVGAAFDAKGYELNTSKEDSIGAREWAEHVPVIRRKVSERSFEALVFKIKVFISARPDQIDHLRAALHDLDFRIPLQRLVSTSEDLGFREKLKGFARSGWKVLWDAYRTTIPQLVSHAMSVRSEVEQKLEKLLEEPLHTEGLRRRWQIQQLRYHVNRGVYILGSNKLRKLADDLENMPEFLQFRTLVRTVFDGDVLGMTRMPGATASSAGSLLRSLKMRVKLPETTDLEMRPELIQVISTLLAYDVIDLPERMGSNSEIAPLHPSASRGKPPTLPFSFLDEVQMLMRNKSPADIALFLDSRFSSHETLALEALELDEQGYS
jgi:hypothetical protein